MLVFRGETSAVPREKKSPCATSFTINPTKNWLVIELVPPRSEPYSDCEIFFERLCSVNGINSERCVCVEFVLCVLHLVFGFLFIQACEF
jgi:hypothetical protein